MELAEASEGETHEPRSWAERTLCSSSFCMRPIVRCRASVTLSLAFMRMSSLKRKTIVPLVPSQISYTKL